MFSYEDSCKGKAYFPSKQAAKLSIVRWRRRAELHAYRCLWCEGWHLGHRLWDEDDEKGNVRPEAAV